MHVVCLAFLVGICDMKWNLRCAIGEYSFD